MKGRGSGIEHCKLCRIQVIHMPFFSAFGMSLRIMHVFNAQVHSSSEQTLIRRSPSIREKYPVHIGKDATLHSSQRVVRNPGRSRQTAYTGSYILVVRPSGYLIHYIS